MEDLTLFMFAFSIGLFLVRYLIKKSGVDFLSAIMNICTTLLILRDESVPSEDLLLFLSPVLLMLMLTFVHLMFSNKRDSY